MKEGGRKSVRRGEDEERWGREKESIKRSNKKKGL